MNKILVIRFSSIGDIVLTTPVVRCIKNQLPGAEVHYLTKEQFGPVLKENPYIDKFWLFNGSFSEIIPALRKEKFDFVVDLHRNLRSLRIRLGLMRPGNSFPKLNFRKWLLVNLRINLLPQLHVVDRYFEAVGNLEVSNDNEGLDFFIPLADEVSPPFPAYTAVVIGGKHNTKIFPPEKVAEVVSKLKHPAVLLGGKEDAERGKKIVELTGGKAVSFCGSLNLNQSASLLKQSSAVLTNDTGLMHIAAALGKKIVSVWGNTIPAFGMYPYLPDGIGESFIAEVGSLSCRPCGKLGHDECPRTHFRCMKDIDTAEILKHLE
jgi:ADP-heptose:LPS heptosyltransferase